VTEALYQTDSYLWEFEATITQADPEAGTLLLDHLIRTKVNLLPPGLREIRTVEIVGLDLQADGGTHVANTREVGPIRVAGYKSKGRLNKRIQIELAS
jgi:misacylated tRNA(Ala) deacylase